MRVKGCINWIVLFLFIIPISLANFDYNETGNFDTLFQTGTGKFNEINIPNANFFNTELANDGITTQKQTPLISDLDGDGLNEIIILDGNTFRLYQNRTLDLAGSFQLPRTGRLSNFITFNIDGDDFTEIIIVEEEHLIIQIIQYNGTDFKNETSINFSGLSGIVASSSAGEAVIKCVGKNKCIIAMVDKSNFATASSLDVIFFNTTFVGHNLRFDNEPIPGKYFCFPKIRVMSVEDIDNDDIDEFVFSAIRVDDGVGDEIAKIYYGEVLDNNSIINDYLVEETLVGNLFEDAGSNSCLAGIELEGTSTDVFPQNYISAPLLFNLKGTQGDGIETVIAFNVGTNDFNMALYNGCSSDGCTISRQSLHPDFLDTDGEIISNIILADVFDDSGNEDYCVMGYEPTTEILRLLCASEKDRFVFQDEIQFEFDTSGRFNVSSGLNEWNTIIHSAQHSQIDTIGTKNTHEIVTSYGIFRLDFELPVSDCRGLSLCSLELIFENPAGDSVLISVDAEKVGLEDLIAMSSTNLWYIDDKFTNSQAQIAPLANAYNPCLDSTWKINTSVEVRVRVIDEEENDVQARVILYHNDNNLQESGWSALQSTSNNPDTGRIFPFSISNISLDFIANKTTANGIIRIMVRDDQPEHQNNPITISRGFTVSSTGVEFNDCTSDEGGTVAEEEEEEEVIEDATLTEDADENAIKNSILAIADLTGLAGTTLWLLLMLMLTALIWFVMAEENKLGGSATLGTIAITNVLFIILGARLGILGTGMVVILVLIGVVIVAVFLGKFFTGLGTSET